MRCRRAFTWIANLLAWGSIAFIIVAHFCELSSGIKTASFFCIIIFGIMYYCETFICSYCSYFMMRVKAAKSYEDIDRMFKAAPKIQLSMECYHYERRSTSNNSSSEERVVTHRAYEVFLYKSWRDASGQFGLDTSAASKDETTPFVLLDLALKVAYANDGTEEDYMRLKTAFIHRNTYDSYQSFSRVDSIPNFHSMYMIQVTDYNPCCVGLGYFIVFGLLTFNAFYSSYVDSYCHLQEFTIKKVISTRQDLRSEQMQNQYAYYDPRMMLTNNQVIVFNPIQPPQTIAMSQVNVVYPVNPSPALFIEPGKAQENIQNQGQTVAPSPASISISNPAPNLAPNPATPNYYNIPGVPSYPPQAYPNQMAYYSIPTQSPAQQQ